MSLKWGFFFSLVLGILKHYIIYLDMGKKIQVVKSLKMSQTSKILFI